MSIKSLLNSAELPMVAGNVLSDVKTRANEVASKVASTFSGAGSFKRLSDAAPSFDETSAQQAIQRAQLVAEDPTGMVMSSIDEEILSMSNSPWQGNAVDQLLADELQSSATQEDNVSASAINAAKAQAENDVEHMVRLVEPGIDEVTFRVMPEVVESRTVEYEAVAPPQFPSAFQKYKGTSSTQWSVNATLTCRTTAEATENLRILNVLRGWTVPFFGVKTGEQWPQKLGAPPPVLTFSGWRAQMVGPVQVVITSLNWNFPQDVDYIPANEFMSDGQFTGRLIPFPTVIKIAIQLVESFSTDQMNGFSLADFRVGQFADAFAPLPRSNQPNEVAAVTSDAAQIAAQQLAQVSAFVGMDSGFNSSTNSFAPIGAGAGRGMINPPAVDAEKTVSELKTVGKQIPRLPSELKSGGGGSFGGGGAGGGW